MNDDRPFIIYGGLDKPLEGIPPWDRRQTEQWDGDREELGPTTPHQGPNLRGLVKEAFVATVVIAVSLGMVVSSLSLIELLRVVRP